MFNDKIKYVFFFALFYRANQNLALKVFNFNGKELSCIKYHEGFLGKRISSVLCIDWNCYKVNYIRKAFYLFF